MTKKHQVTKAVVLVGGKGTRLRSVVSDVPKPLAPIAGKPFLDHLLRDLARQGLQEVTLAAGYMAEMFSSYKERASEFGLSSIRISREVEPLGTAGALSLLRDLFAQDEVFLMVNGDTFFQGDLRRFLEFDMKSNLVHIGLCYVDDLARFGSVKVSNRGFVEAFLEKRSGESGYVNAGLYLLSAKIFDHIPAGKSSSLEVDIFPSLVQYERISAEPLCGSFFDIGIPESYFSFHLDLLMQEASEEYGAGFVHILLTWLQGGRILSAKGALSGPVLAALSRRAYVKEIESAFERHLCFLGKNDLCVVPNDLKVSNLRQYPVKLVGSSGNAVDGVIRKNLDAGTLRYFELLSNVPAEIVNFFRPLTRYLFLDRDGVIIKYVQYLKDAEEVELTSGIVELLARFHGAGYRVVMVTNQSGIGREYYSQEQFRRVQHRVSELLAAKGQWIDASYFSDFIEGSKRSTSLLWPTMRKPRPAMLFEEAQFWNIDSKKSVMVGDNSSDMEWAENAGIKRMYYLENKDLVLEKAILGAAIKIQHLNDIPL